MNYEDFQDYNRAVFVFTERLLRATAPLIFLVEKSEKRFAVKDKTGKIINIYDIEEEANKEAEVLNKLYKFSVESIDHITFVELKNLKENFFND